VYRAVDLVLREGDLELVREKTLGSNLGERLIELLVARGLEGDELGRDAAPEQSALDEPRLAESELRSPRPDSDDGRIGPRLRRH
jgi:hypothetical protein